MKDKVTVQHWDDHDKVMVKGFITKETMDFIDNRYVVLRNFIPKDIIDMTLDSWKAIENHPEAYSAFFELEDDITNNSPKSSLKKSEGCYCFPPAIALHHWLKNALEPVFSFDLTETYSYTRKYKRGAYLKSHTDRPSCEISATICLDYKTDDNTPWKIWVQNDRDYLDDAFDNQEALSEYQKMSISKRKGCVAVSLEVGDVLLYQGPNIPHWRDTFLGDYSSHMFLHFINTHGAMIRLPDFQMKNSISRTSFNLCPTQSHANQKPRSALTFDGRENRHAFEQTSPDFKRASKAWNANSLPEPNMKFSDFVNNYKIELVEKKK